VWFANLLRRFVSGSISNDSFDYEANKLVIFFRDETLRSVYEIAWTFYSDVFPHRLVGRHKLSIEERRLFARMILLLRSGHDAAPSESLTPRTDDFWPFGTPDQLHAARGNPTYFHGYSRIAL